MRQFSFILFFIGLIAHRIPSCTSQASLETFCKTLIPADYKIYKPPPNGNKPVDVFVAFQILDIGEIDEEQMDFRLHTFIVTIWNDTRLQLERYKGKTAVIYASCRSYIWTPDIFFETAKSVETFQDTSPSTLLKVLEDGAVFMSTRYSFRATCNMYLKHYPFDTQRCEFLVSFISSSDSVAKLIWSGNHESPYKETYHSINNVRDSDPLQFYLEDPNIGSVTEIFNSGNYTTLKAIFTLVRRLTGSIVSTYAPSTMIVAMSWVSFWLKVDAVPARVTLSVTSLLTLCTQADQYKSQMPPVNYIKAIDIWLFVCILMVFATLLEFSVCYNLHCKKCSKCSGENINIHKENSSTPENNRNVLNVSKVNPWLNENKKKIKFIYSNVKESRSTKLMNIKCKKCQSYRTLGFRIDIISRKIFPGFFLTFAIIYWVYYLRIYSEDT